MVGVTKSEHRGAGSSSSASVLSRILRGDDVAQTFPQTSQYRSGGVSACGLAALNCARVVFESKQNDEERLRSLLDSKTTDEIMVATDCWKGSSHLEVEQLLALQLFSRSMKLVETKFASVSHGKLRELIAELRDTPSINGCAAVIITRPPEIVVCLKVPLKGPAPTATSSNVVLAVFDSHPRPSHPEGAGWFFTKSLDQMAKHLHGLLAVDPRLLAETGMQWQAQLLSNFSGHIIVPTRAHHLLKPEDELQQVLWDSTLAILKLQAELEETKFQNAALTDMNKRYEDELDALERKNRGMRQRLEVAERQSHVATSQLSGQGHRLSADVKGKRPERPSGSASRPSGSGDAPMVVDALSSDHLQALQAHNAFLEEDQRLRAEREALVKTAVGIFECPVCFDKHPETDVARVRMCGHVLCRECARGYILTKIQERTFPMTCPICPTDKASRESGVIEEDLIQQTNIPQKELEILEELQLAAYSVPIYCRRCQNTVFVDRGEYQESRIVTCPLPGCTYAWCRHCQQEIAAGPVQHSCDGSLELATLMKDRGWKACPGCKTNIQKTDGCNHMTCPSPGCNTHFCYACGESIVRSTRREELQRAISRHYRKCEFIRVNIPDRGMPP